MIQYANKRDISGTQSKAEVLIEALPYLKQFAGKRVVIKIGGELLKDEEDAKSLAQDLTLLKSVGINVIVCHGGGPQISEMMAAVNKSPEFVDGHRVTDAETLEITAMVLLGKLNRALVSLLNAHGPQAIGLSGVDGRLFLVNPKDENLGFVGNIDAVDPDPVTKVLDAGYIPVVSSIGMDKDGVVYNINADMAAGELAKAVGAEKFVVLTNVEGLYESFGDKDSLISEIDAKALKELLDSGTLSAGMLPKAECILLALEAGVSKAHMLDGRVRHAVLLEIFTPEGIGTMVVPN